MALDNAALRFGAGAGVRCSISDAPEVTGGSGPGVEEISAFTFFCSSDGKERSVAFSGDLTRPPSISHVEGKGCCFVSSRSELKFRLRTVLPLKRRLRLTGTP